MKNEKIKRLLETFEDMHIDPIDQDQRVSIWCNNSMGITMLVEFSRGNSMHYHLQDDMWSMVKAFKDRTEHEDNYLKIRYGIGYENLCCIAERIYGVILSYNPDYEREMEVLGAYTED